MGPPGGLQLDESLPQPSAWSTEAERPAALKPETQPVHRSESAMPDVSNDHLLD